MNVEDKGNEMSAPAEDRPANLSAFADRPRGLRYTCVRCDTELEVRIVEDEGRVLWCPGCQAVIGHSFPLRRPL